jgi:hypothetical protein
MTSVFFGVAALAGVNIALPNIIPMIKTMTTKTHFFMADLLWLKIDAGATCCRRRMMDA